MNNKNPNIQNFNIQNQNIQNPKKIDSNGNEFELGEDLFNAAGQVGVPPMTGGLITRGLVERAEKILANKKP